MSVPSIYDVMSVFFWWLIQRTELQFQSRLYFLANTLCKIEGRFKQSGDESFTYLTYIEWLSCNALSENSDNLKSSKALEGKKQKQKQTLCFRCKESKNCRGSVCLQTFSFAEISTLPEPPSVSLCSADSQGLRADSVSPWEKCPAEALLSAWDAVIRSRMAGRFHTGHSNYL